MSHIIGKREYAALGLVTLGVNAKKKKKRPNIWSFTKTKIAAMECMKRQQTLKDSEDLNKLSRTLSYNEPQGEELEEVQVEEGVLSIHQEARIQLVAFNFMLLFSFLSIQD